MRTYVVERLVDTVLTCVAISFVVFVFLHLAGDPAKVLLPPEASKEAVADLRRSLGLDDPFLVQYWHFVTGLFTGDLHRVHVHHGARGCWCLLRGGRAYRQHQPQHGTASDPSPATTCTHIAIPGNVGGLYPAPRRGA